MKKLLLLFPLFVILGCHPDTSCCTVIELNADLVFRNKAGENMLDSTTAGYFVTDSIRTFVMEKGKKTEVYRIGYAAPRDFRLLRNEENGEPYLRFFIMGSMQGDIATTYLRLNAFREDTIQAQIIKNGSYTSYRKLWYNGELKYDRDAQPSYVASYSRFIEIVK